MLKELQIIQTIAGQIPNAEALRDDAYWEPTTGCLYTTDLLVEGQHFDLSYFSPADLAWKAGAVNISDIAAMGGQPQSLLVSLGLPEWVETGFIQAFYQSLQALAEQLNCQIVGGDTVGAPQVIVNITAIGQLPVGAHVGLRCQAQPGDLIITTGYSGLSAAGLLAFQHKLEGFETCKQAHLRPVPRVTEGLLLSKQFERYALMDTSDGLADAALKLAQQSQVTLALDASAIPLHPELKTLACKTGKTPLELALYGGEDFQLLACVPETTRELLEHFQVIGCVKAGAPEAVLTDAEGQTLEVLTLEKTYHHFSERLS